MTYNGVARSPVDPTDGTIRVEANVFHYNAALSVRGPSDGGVRNRAWIYHVVEVFGVAG